MRHYDGINAIEVNFLNVRLGDPIFFKQYDNNNILEIQVLQNDTEWILSNETVTTFFLMPDGTTILEKNATIVGGNAHIVIDNNILSQSGTMYMEVNVVNNVGEISTSPRITMTVETTIDRNGAAQTVVQWDILTEIQTIKTMFNALTVAGNNLLKNSDFMANTSYWILGTGWALDTVNTIDKTANAVAISRTGLGADSASFLSTGTNAVTNPMSAKQGDIITLSIWVKTPDYTLIDSTGLTTFLRELNGSYGFLADSTIKTITPVNNNWSKITLTHTVTNVSTAFIQLYLKMARNGTVYLTKFQIEKNNKASDWKPNELDKVERKLDVSNRINNSSIKTNTTGFQVDASWARDTLISRNTNSYPFKISRTGMGADSVQNVLTGHTDGYNPITATVNETYVVSVWVRSPDITLIDGTLPSVTIRGMDSFYNSLETFSVNIKPSASNTWERFYVPITLTHLSTARVSTYFTMRRNGTLYVSEPQLEKGVYPTEWKQSATDLAASSGSIDADTLDSYHASAFVMRDTTSINVKDYGALGNGVANDSTAIQAALDVLEATGGTLLFPKGTYMLSTALRVPSYCKLQGVGSTVLKRNAAIDNLVRNKADGTTGGYLANSNITLDNLSFDGNAATYGGTSCTLVAFGHCTDITIQNCKFANIYDWHELELNGVKKVLVQNCVFAQYGEGTGATGATEMIQLDIMLSSAQFPWFAPYDSTTCLQVDIVNNRFTASTNTTYKTFSAIGNHSFQSTKIHDSVNIVGNHFENLLYAIRLNDTHRMSVDGNTFTNCTYGVHIEDYRNYASQNGCEDVLICNNRYKGNLVVDGETLTEGRFIAINPSLSTNAIKTINVSIVNNTASDVAKYAVAGTWEKGTISCNTFYNIGKHGIYLYGGNMYTVTGNVVTQCAKNDASGATIYTGGNTNETLNNCTISGNIVEKIILGTSSTAAHTFVIGNTATIGIENNSSATVKSNVKAGVYVA